MAKINLKDLSALDLVQYEQMAKSICAKYEKTAKNYCNTLDRESGSYKIFEKYNEIYMKISQEMERRLNEIS